MPKVCPVLLVVLVALAFARPAGAQSTICVSVTSSGVPADAPAEKPSLSADGRFVVFRSQSGNLHGGLNNGTWSVFVHDALTGTTECVSDPSVGVRGNGSVFAEAAISADGRYVAFDSSSTNIVPGVAVGLYVRDRVTGTTECVADGTAENRGAYWPSLSHDGRFVAFTSDIIGLAPGGTVGESYVYLTDRQAHTTQRLARADDLYHNRDCFPATVMSGDGRFVGWTSTDPSLVQGDTNGKGDIFLLDRQTGTTIRVSVASDGTEGNGVSERPALSADGRFVAFESDADNLVPSDTNGKRDVFVHDCLTGATERVSVSSAGSQGIGNSYSPSISGDGRCVTFWSGNPNFFPGPNDSAVICLRDRRTGTTEIVSLAADGSAGTATLPSAISADGRHVAYQQTHSGKLLYRHDRQAPASVTVAPQTGRIGQSVALPATLVPAAAGSVKAGEDLRFAVEGDAAGEGVTDAAGATAGAYTIPEGTGPGPRTVTVDHPASARYVDASATGTLTVLKGNSALSLYGASGAVGQSVELKALLTCGPIKVASRTVSFAVDGAFAGTTTTDGSGVARGMYTIPAGKALGAHSVTASFAGDNVYNTSARTAAVLTVKPAALLSLYPAVGVLGGSANLRCILLSGSTRLAGKTVWFSVDGTPAGSAMTDAEGVATRAYSIALGFGAGTHNVSVAFAGDANYASATRTAACLTVQKANTSFSLYAASGCLGGAATLKAILLSGSTRVAGRTVAFAVDGTPVGSGITDGTGVAACSVPIALASTPGPHSVTVSFAGDAVYNASSRSASVLTVTRVPTALSLYAASGLVGQTATLKAILLSGGTRLSGKTVAFSVEGVAAGSGTTDANGVASVSYTLPSLSIGVHNVTATFAGDATYAPASRTTAALTVK